MYYIFPRCECVNIIHTANIKLKLWLKNTIFGHIKSQKGPNLKLLDMMRFQIPNSNFKYDIVIYGH